MVEHPEPGVYSINEQHCLIWTTGDIHGSWVVALIPERNVAYVIPHDVTIEDGSDYGVNIFANAFTASVNDGVAHVGAVFGRAKEINDALGELEPLLVRIAEEAWAHYRKATESRTDTVDV